MQKEVLRVEHLSKCNHLQNVLQSVSFRVLTKEKVALLSNPLEKQSMVDILFRGDSLNTGRVFINETLCQKNISEGLGEGGIYYIGADGNFNPDMTVAKNLFLSLPKLLPGIWINNRMLYKEVSRLLNKYGVRDIAPKMRGDSLSSHQILCLQVIVAIEKGAQLIVFDDVFDRIGSNGLKNIEQIIQLLYRRDISVLFLANRYHEIFDGFDSLIILKNGVTIERLKGDQITFHNFIRYYSSTAARKTKNNLLQNTAFTITNGKMELPMDEGEVLGIWSLDGDYLIRLGEQKWEFVSGIHGNSGRIALSMNGYRQDKIYKEMSLVDNITYLANDKVSNFLGIINKRMQIHMAQYVLGLIHSENLMDKYKNRQTLKEITLIDQLKLITAKWLCISPQVFIYVNPFMALDESSIQEFQEILQDLVKLKISIIIISVNYAWLELTCDTVISVKESEGKSNMHD